MQYYYYISANKVHMLLDQLPREHLQEKEVSWSLGFKGFLGITSKRKQQENAIRKLDLVVEALRSMGLVGSVSSPLDYFEGSAPTRWGIFHIGKNHPLKDLGDKAPVVFFGESDSDRYILFGSPKNMMGRDHRQEFSAIWSASDVIHYVLSEIAEDATKQNTESVESIVDTKLWAESYSKKLELIWHRLVAQAPVNVENLSFLARTFSVAKTDQGNLILGSPLFVSA